MIVYAFVILTVLGIISLAFNSFLAVVFVKAIFQDFGHLRKLPYFLYCLQILICNLLGLLVKFAYVIPNSVWDNDKTRWDENYVAVMAIIETFVYHGELFFILALAIHRLFIFFSFKWASQLYACCVKIGIIWFLVGLFVFGQCYFECFDTTISPNTIPNGAWDDVKFYSVCVTNTLPKAIFKHLTTIINDYLPVVTLLFYALIVIKIRYNQRIRVQKVDPKAKKPTVPRQSKQQHDLIIFCQALVTYGCFFFKFRVLNTIGYENSSHGILLTCLIYVSIYVRDTTQAVFLLAFNQNVRNIARSLLFRQPNTNKTIPITSRSNRTDLSSYVVSKA